MDEESVLFGIRNMFALGNYQALINQISSSRNLQSPDATLEAQTYLYRSYVAQGKFNLVLSDIKDTDDVDAGLRAVRLLALYKQHPSDDLLQQGQQLFEQGTNRVHPVVQVIVASLFVNGGKLEDALRVLHVRSKKLEW